MQLEFILLMNLKTYTIASGITAAFMVLAVIVAFTTTPNAATGNNAQAPSPVTQKVEGNTSVTQEVRIPSNNSVTQSVSVQE